MKQSHKANFMGFSLIFVAAEHFISPIVSSGLTSESDHFSESCPRKSQVIEGLKSSKMVFSMLFHDIHRTNDDLTRQKFHSSESEKSWSLSVVKIAAP
jgi:hypothetical protein